MDETFESDMSEDNLVVCFWVIFVWYPFKDGGNGVLPFHCCLEKGRRSSLYLGREEV